ncbi:MAG: hypothetical protein WCR23_04355 [Planctomycetota bacterium]|jgi:hypothetical protein|nr:hypothetical protein [Planctomycetia bacterium]
MLVLTINIFEAAFDDWLIVDSNGAIALCGGARTPIWRNET